MAVSFMTSTPYSPELANAVSQAVIHGYNIGAQETASAAEQKFQQQQTAYKEQADTLRAALKQRGDERKALVEQKEKSITALGKVYEDRIKDNRSLLANAPDHDPAAIGRIASQVKNDEQALSDMWQKFNSDPVGFQIPSTTSNMSMLPDDASKMSQAYQQSKALDLGEKLAKSNTAQNDAAVSNYWFSSSGGTISKPSEANTMDLIKARDFRIANPRGGRGGAKKALDTMGNPLNNDQLKRIQGALQSQPDLHSEYRRAWDSYHSMPEGDDKAAAGSALKESENKMRTNYGVLGRYAQDNASDSERQFISRLGLGLSGETMTDDASKLMNTYNSATDPNVRALTAHLYRGLGFGSVPGAPVYNSSSLFQLPSNDDNDTFDATGGGDLFSKYH